MTEQKVAEQTFEGTDTPLAEIRDKSGALPSYAWPGGYPIYYLDRDNNVLCPKCANREVNASQAVVAYDIYWEGPTMPCDDCGDDIESAYGDPDDV